MGTEQNALLGMSWHQRALLVLLVRAGERGLGADDLAEPTDRTVLNSLVTRGLAREHVGPADRPRAWRFTARPDGVQLAAAVLLRANAGSEHPSAIERLRRAKALGAFPAPAPAPAPQVARAAE